METDPYDVLDVIINACEQNNGLCMDVSVERLRLAHAIAAALREADLLARPTD